MARRSTAEEVADLRQYLDEVRSVPLLTPAEEVELAARIRAGAEAAAKLAAAKEEGAAPLAPSEEAELRRLVADGDEVPALMALSLAVMAAASAYRPADSRLLLRKIADQQKSCGSSWSDARANDRSASGTPSSVPHWVCDLAPRDQMRAGGVSTISASRTAASACSRASSMPLKTSAKAR